MAATTLVASCCCVFTRSWSGRGRPNSHPTLSAWRRSASLHFEKLRNSNKMKNHLLLSSQLDPTTATNTGLCSQITLPSGQSSWAGLPSFSVKPSTLGRPIHVTIHSQRSVIVQANPGLFSSRSSTTTMFSRLAAIASAVPIGFCFS